MIHVGYSKSGDSSSWGFKILGIQSLGTQNLGIQAQGNQILCTQNLGIQNLRYSNSGGFKIWVFKVVVPSETAKKAIFPIFWQYCSGLDPTRSLPQALKL